MTKNKIFTFGAAIALVLSFQLSAFARSSDGWKTVGSFYSWYLKSEDHNPKKLKKFLSTELYQKVEKMEAGEINEYFTRKSKDINLVDFSKYELEDCGFSKDMAFCYVHLWNKNVYFAKMHVRAIFEKGKWKIDEATGITDKEALEKAVEVKIEPLELKNNLISIERPVHPPAAKAVCALGEVVVEIVVDENGKVVSADAISGHPLLRTAAKGAALKAVFSPFVVDGKPTKIR